MRGVYCIYQSLFIYPCLSLPRHIIARIYVYAHRFVFVDLSLSLFLPSPPSFSPAAATNQTKKRVKSSEALTLYDPVNEKWNGKVPPLIFFFPLGKKKEQNSTLLGRGRSSEENFVLQDGLELPYVAYDAD